MQIATINTIRILLWASVSNWHSLTSVVSAPLLSAGRHQHSASVLARFTSFSKCVPIPRKPLFPGIKATDFGGIAKRVFLRYNKALLRKTTLTLRFRKAYRYNEIEISEWK